MSAAIKLAISALQDVVDGCEEPHVTKSVLAALRKAQDGDGLHREEVARLRQAIADAAYTLERARIWNGMGWTYNPLHSFHYLPLRDRLRKILEEQGKSNG